MDTFLSLARRLSALAFGIVVGAVAMFASPSVYAATAAQAQANCQLEANSLGYGANCVVWTQAKNQSGGDPNYYGYKVVWADGSAAGGWYGFTGAPPQPNPCASLAGFSEDFAYGKGQSLPTLPGQIKREVPDGNNDGGFVACYGTFAASGTPTMDAYGWLHVHATLTWSGNAGTSDGATAGGDSYIGSNGAPMSPAPQTSPGQSPQLCGGGSCYDPNSNQFCGVSGGSQFCLPGNTASSAAGGCVAAGGSMLCGGSPSPPSPLGQSGSTITNPGTQIQSSDQYTQADGSTGALSKVTINTYAGPGATVSSGATSTSTAASNSSQLKTGPASSSTSAPASSSSASGDSYGGGTDCNTPPVCRGDAVMCGETLQEWRTMCSAHTDMQGVIGDGKGPPTFASDSTKYSQSDVWQQQSTGNTTGDAANNGNYDSSGFGYGTTCPLQDLNIPFQNSSFVVPLSEGCVIGPWLRAVIIGFALFSAAVITAGGRG